MAALEDQFKDFISIGIVTVSSTTTGARATSNLDAPNDAFICQAISFQALSTGTGSVYICNRATPTLTDGRQMGILWEIPPPSSSPVSRPVFVIGNPSSPSAIDLSQLYVLPTVSGEGARISVLL